MVLMLIVFLIVLALAYFVSKMISKQGSALQRKKNLKVIESLQIAPHKYIQLIKVGQKYYAIAISKDNITTIDTVCEKELDLTDYTNKEVSFKKVLRRISKNYDQEVTSDEK